MLIKSVTWSVLHYVIGSIAEISFHTFSLAKFVFTQLAEWRYANGKQVAILYHEACGFESPETQGPVVNFNILRPDGSFVGYAQVGIHKGSVSHLLSAESHLYGFI